ncbi:hypothetical protein FJP64_13960 [Kosakonia cowanii]|nr:hypothetical protein FJP70_13475 [Kosakonia cowanii]TPD88522.1 hypothetical protein FJP67_13485 [Kosakonia cowanii]TPE04388.1 hypothetical protein FJP64_13960 [Kosakonia cowanii]
MATCNLTIQVKVKWWLPVYLRTLALMCLMMRCEPDYEKVRAFIVKRGISQKLMATAVKSKRE